FPFSNVRVSSGESRFFFCIFAMFFKIEILTLFIRILAISSFLQGSYATVIVLINPRRRYSYREIKLVYTRPPYPRDERTPYLFRHWITLTADRSKPRMADGICFVGF